MKTNLLIALIKVWTGLAISREPQSSKSTTGTSWVLAIVFLAANLTLSICTFAQSPYTSVASGPWDADATWSGVGIPVAGNVANIANTHNVTVSAANAACATVNVNNGGTLTITGFTL
ncbi:MAG TPA: hypothetical protein VK589_25425, partial [Chryseolinea sp.]|nr:hypothetical protein [Chryseolinea sp.]